MSAHAGFTDSDASKIAHALGKAKRSSSGEWSCLCPAHDDHEPSCSICTKNGRLLVKCHVGCDQGAVIAALRSRNLWPNGPEHAINGGGKKRDTDPADDEWHPIVPPPSDAPKPLDHQLRCDMLHEYRGSGGELLFYVKRVEQRGESRKQFYPLTYGALKKNGTTTKGWHNRAPDTPRPLFGLDVLAAWPPDAPVILFEGEKKAGIAQDLFPDRVCMSWMGGAQADHHADLTPLKDRSVILWPDADEPGRKAMARIAKRLPQARIVDTKGLPEGFDAADLRCDDPEQWLNDRLVEQQELPQAEWRDVRLSDWANRPISDQQWIVPDWIPTGCVTGLYGPPGVNKTDFLLQLLMAGWCSSGANYPRSGRFMACSARTPKKVSRGGHRGSLNTTG